MKGSIEPEIFSSVKLCDNCPTCDLWKWSGDMYAVLLVIVRRLISRLLWKLEQAILFTAVATAFVIKGMNDPILNVILNSYALAIALSMLKRPRRVSGSAISGCIILEDMAYVSSPVDDKFQLCATDRTTIDNAS
jgi:hypothetical protein